MPGPAGTSAATRAMALCTVICLVAVVAYSVALGSSGWLWFGWVVLGLCTADVAAIRIPR
ncbi:MAG: hypothetical protein QOF98_2385 [Streptomyces sp.]|nr:hypothetical protein [Streptomyces sp.]